MISARCAAPIAACEVDQTYPARAGYGTISPEDLELFHLVDDTASAFQILTEGLTKHYLEPEAPLAPPDIATPEIAKSRI